MISSIQPAIDPANKPTFLLDWELTLKCNLDCSYCHDGGPFAGHDTTAEHPDLNSCLDAIDFMYRYVDLYLSKKSSWTKHVVLNVYGGESLFHPDIETILQEVKKRHIAYSQSWSLAVSCTTNGVIGHRLMSRISDYIDEFTISYHAESLPKQKDLVKENLLYLKSKNKRLKCVILMHGDQKYWPELLDQIDFCKANEINHLPKQLDGDIASNYSAQKIIWFKNRWDQHLPEPSREKQKEIVESRSELQGDHPVSLTKVGRSCCGGRMMCVDDDLKLPVNYITNNNFLGWSCSVNWFFLFIRQHTGEVFVNKDCRMNFDGSVSPIGHLTDTQKLLDETKLRLQSNNMPYMICAKDHCLCGLCAPKAKNLSDFESLMAKYVLHAV